MEVGLGGCDALRDRAAGSEVIPSSADSGGDSGQSQPEEVELTERRRWMQGLLRGLFTRGTTHSSPTTPAAGRPGDDRPLELTGRSVGRADSPSSSVLSSKAGLSRPASSVHMGPLLLLLLDLEGGDGVVALSSVVGEAGDLGGLLAVVRSSPLSLRRASELSC